MKHADRVPYVHMRPNRPLAIEAIIFATCALGKMSPRRLTALVEVRLPWTPPRTEIGEACRRMLNAGRMIAEYDHGQAMPSFYMIPPP